MSVKRIVWTDGGLITRFVAAIAVRLKSLTLGKPKRRKTLSELQVFRTEFPLSRVKGGDARRAAELSLDSLIPLPLEQLMVFGRKSLAQPALEIAAIKKEDLAALTSEYPKRRWIALEPDWAILTPRAQSISRNRALFAMLSLSLFTAGLGYLYTKLYTEFENRIDRAVTTERVLRKAALARAEISNDTRIWDQLVENGVLETAPNVLLSRLSLLNQTTPDTAYWTRVKMSGSVVEITGKAKDPFVVLEALSSIESVGSAQFADALEGETRGGYSDFKIAVAFESESE